MYSFIFLLFAWLLPLGSCYQAFEKADFLSNNSAPRIHDVSKLVFDELDTLPTPVEPTPDKTEKSLFIRAGELKTPQECRETGVCLRYQMAGNGAPSLYTLWQETTSFGWYMLPQPNPPPAIPDLDTMITGMGALKNQFHKYQFRYDQPWIPDQRSERGWFMAGYDLFVNPVSGIIINTWSYSPKEPVVRPGDPVPTPLPIRRRSDFSWLTYAHDCNYNPDGLTGLEWMVSYNVLNPSALEVAKFVMAANNQRLGPWPGLRLEGGSADADAILGTPNGYGSAWIVINRLALVGIKRVSEIFVFSADDGWSICFAIHLEDEDPPE